MAVILQLRVCAGIMMRRVGEVSAQSCQQCEKQAGIAHGRAITDIYHQLLINEQPADVHIPQRSDGRKEDVHIAQRCFSIGYTR